MCGITGFWGAAGDADALTRTAAAMAAAIAHRGPDGQGTWVEAECGLALGHRRLSILDLSAAANQPMTSVTGRYKLSYNGEFYNYAEIGRELAAAGVSCNAHSDTAVLLAAIETWGVVAAVQRCRGMFAFAIWDRRERTLSLVRDRLGIKPLYVYRHHGTLLFASELKTMHAHPAFEAQIDDGVMSGYLRYRYVAAPRTIYRHTEKLLPGHILTLKAPDDGTPSVPYWSAREVAVAGRDQPFVGSDAEAESALEAVLQEAVGQHMVSDVPVGAFLSGGIDSSVVVALMRAHTPRPVRTFSLGFRDAQFDEAPDAALVARHLGTEHTELYIDDAQVRDVIPQLATMYDEPFADPSQLPTHLVSKLAREHVIVALSGDGGDELFGGYTRYQWVPRTWRKLGAMPGPVRAAALGAIRAVSPGQINRMVDPLQRLLPRGARQRQIGDKLHKLAADGQVGSADDLYRAVASGHQEPEQLLQALQAHPDHLRAVLDSLPALDPVSRMMLADLLTYLVDDVLAKVDRASMAVALESRVPLLDHRVVEFAWRLPMSLKIRDGQGKWLLRRVLARHVPTAMFERPKTGFDLPIAQWLRGPLRDWAGDLLSTPRLGESGLFDARAVQRLLAEHASGARNHRDVLWAILMFETWRHRWAPAAVPAGV